MNFADFNIKRKFINSLILAENMRLKSLVLNENELEVKFADFSMRRKARVVGSRFL